MCKKQSKKEAWTKEGNGIIVNRQKGNRRRKVGEEAGWAKENG